MILVGGALQEFVKVQEHGWGCVRAWSRVCEGTVEGVQGNTQSNYECIVRKNLSLLFKVLTDPKQLMDLVGLCITSIMALSFKAQTCDWSWDVWFVEGHVSKTKSSLR